MRWRSSLQASVESAESEWRVKLDASTKELADARGQATSLAEKAAALEQEVAQSAQAGEMQGQLAALQAQLLGQEAEKKEVGGEAKQLLRGLARVGDGAGEGGGRGKRHGGGRGIQAA